MRAPSERGPLIAACGIAAPHEPGGARTVSGPLSTAVALFKAIVGTGIFALPTAIRATGWALGSLCVLGLAFASTFGMGAVIYSIQELRTRSAVPAEPRATAQPASHPPDRIEYHHLLRAVFPRVHRLGMTLAVAGQLGSVISFMSLVATTVTELWPAASRGLVLVVMMCIVTPLALLRTTSHPLFKLAMGGGSVAVVVAMLAVLGFGISARGLAPISTLSAADPSGLGLLFGVCMVMFTAPMEAVSIEQDMADRSRFHQVLRATFTFITASYILFGVLAYACFGEATGRVRRDGEWVEKTILQNIDGGAAGAFIKLALCVDLCMMTPVTLLPASKAIEEALGAYESRRPALNVALLRTAIVGGCTLAAGLLDNFELIVALVGALTAGVVCYVFPALCYVALCAHRLTPAQLATARAVAVLGACASAFATVQVLWGAAAGGGSG